jgi:hypothetical protein
MARVIREDNKASGPSSEQRYVLAVEFKSPHTATKNDIVAYRNSYEGHRKNRP